MAHSFAREAVVPERNLLTEALKRGIGSVTVEGVKRELAQRPLIRGEAGRPRDGDDARHARRRKRG